jgi:spermidine synthase
VVHVARELFAYGRLEPDAIEMRIQDARPFLRREQRRFDVVLADAYDHLYSLPWPLVTREAFSAMADRLEPGGILIVTVSTPVEGRGTVFLERVLATMGDVFPYLRVYLSEPDLHPALTQEVLVVAAFAPGDLPAVEWPTARVGAAGIPFRDDFAPVEYLQALRAFHDPAW